jgi:predicted acylesterase/phospholipase RssA
MNRINVPHLPAPIDVTHAAHSRATSNVMMTRQTKVAIALSGGGAKGDFEVGALRYLQENYGRPHIVTGTSVGAISAIKIAEGGGAALPQVGGWLAQDDLERIWLRLQQNSDMFIPRAEWEFVFSGRGSGSDSGFSLDGLSASVLTELVDVQSKIAPLAQATAATLPIEVATFLAAGPAAMLAAQGAVAMGGDAAGAFLQQLVNALRASSLFSLKPIYDLARSYEPGWSPTGPGSRGASIAVCQRDNARLVLLARGVDDGLYWSEQTSAAVATVGLPPEHRPQVAVWTAWSLLASDIASDPQVCLNAAGNIEAVVIADRDGTMIVRHVANPDGDEGLLRWMTAESLGEPVDAQGAPTGARLKGRPTVARRHVPAGGAATQANECLVAAIDTDGQPRVRTKIFDLDTWQNPGYLAPGIVMVGNLSAIDVDGTITLMGRTSDHTPMYWRWGNWQAWPGHVNSDITLISAAGHVEAYARHEDYSVWRRVQTDTASDRWADWTRLGDGSLSVTSNVAVCSAANGRLHIYARGADFALWTIAQLPVGDFEPRWRSLGTPPDVVLLADPIVIRNRDGRLQVFAVCSDLAIWTIAQNATFTGWSPWESLGGSVFPGIQVRLATVQLESGEVRLINEAGVFVGAPNEPVVSRIDAAIASAAIPGVFTPVRLNQQTYVDGGIRSTTPVQAAIDAGADVVFAVVASNEEAGERPTFAEAGALDIALRGLVGIATEAVKENELATNWKTPVTIIRPSVKVPPADDPVLSRWLSHPPHAIAESQVHDAFTIDPGRIRISMDYGYMRAYDVLAAEDAAGARLRTDAIVLLRTQIWQLEEGFYKAYSEYVAESNNRPTPGIATGIAFMLDNRSLDGIRALKSQLRSAIEARRARGELLPAGAETWPRQWERHTWNPPAPTPFDSFTVGGQSGSTVPAVTFPAGTTP